MTSKTIFVVGLCRSGTTWLGEILGSHPDITTTNEPAGIMPKVLQMLWDPSTKSTLLQPVLDFYHEKTETVGTEFYCDKSHPNLWLMDELAEAFPGVKFVGILRDPYPTIASMKVQQHSLKENFFAKGDCPESYVERGAIRWLENFRKIVESEWRDDFYLINYESLVQEPEEELEWLATFLELDTPFPIPSANLDSLTKWKKSLTEVDMMAIDRILFDG